MADKVNKVRADYNARYHSGPRRLSQIKYFVIHTAEAEAPKTGAENVGRYMESQNARGSTHFGVDINSTQRYLPDSIVAWGAPPLNISGLHVECLGHARYNRKKWLTDYAPMFERLGWLIANRCRKYEIPMKLLTIDQLRRKGITPQVGGITTHADINQVWDDSDHWDPGKNFPLDVVMAWVEFYAQGWLKAKVSKRILHIHNSGKRVKKLQADLQSAGYFDFEPDGVFDVGTERAVKRFQKSVGLSATGVVDLSTWRALDSVL